MAENFFLDNPELSFRLGQTELAEAVRLREAGFTQRDRFPEAPGSYEEAVGLYEAVLAMVGELCARKIAPRARSVDREGVRFEDGRVCYAEGTRQSLEEFRQAGLMGVTLPRRYGGLNFPNTVYSLMMEMVARADASLHNLVGLQEIGETILRFGSDDQRERYLPRLASGEADGAMALTEPDAGSDLQAVRTRAWQDPATGQWRLNGTKQFITNGCARIILVLARSEEGTRDGRGLSMFVCEAGPRVRVRRIEEKMGLHGSPTCEIEFDDAPAELVGARRRGLTRYVMSLMNGARVGVSAQAVGIAEAAYRSAREYAANRRQFGRAIEEFPAVYEMLVRSRVKLAGARALLYETTRYVDLRDGCERSGDLAGAKRWDRIASVLTPLTKAYSTEVANEVAYDSLQIHGGSGYMKDYDVERHCRDARVTNIYEGTTQLQYVAAMGGVMNRVLDPLVDRLAALPYQGRARDLAEALGRARENLARAVAYVAERREGDYQDLMARRLCHSETLVLTGYLLLRDLLADPGREALAERFVAEAVPQVEMDTAAVCSGDRSLIDRRAEVV
ncbi:acyl-CoA dehydrogenase family protein [Deferrisoma camini]|uniref:acyl-CoA dehydrogenase family protein n=1 Tax=Deferrisoma camini TaxID=1035120 RepID=UPI00046D857F|nr:acyl-CoA dehydrogenase family protein [Deferrisoma camini]